MIRHLKESGKKEEQILSMNFESMEYRDMDVRAFYQYVKERMLPDRRMYLFFVELQRLDQWEDAVNSFRVDFDCDIYITGSNAYLLSSEYSTYLSGRYVEIRMLPLSFREFLEFHGYEIQERKTPTGVIRRRPYDASGEPAEWEELFEAYIHYGGMPGLVDVGLAQDKVLALLDGVFPLSF